MLENINPVKKKQNSSFLPEENITKNFQDNKKGSISFQQPANSDIAGFYDWSKPSHIVNLNQQNANQSSSSSQESSQHNSLNHSIDTDELLQSQRPQSDDSISIDSRDIMGPPPVQKKIYSQQYSQMTVKQLQIQLKQMRQQLLSMNSQANNKLDKYDLFFSRSIKNKEESPYQVLLKQIETNQIILKQQNVDFNKLKNMQNQLQKKDYLVQLQELCTSAKEKISDMQKIKHEKWVDTQKTDKLLKQIQMIESSQDHFKEIKQLIKKLMFYYKKLQSQTAKFKQLDYEKDQIQQKSVQVTQKLDELSLMAQNKRLLVSSNRNYIVLKQKQSQMSVNCVGALKKKEIALRAIKMNSQALQRQNQILKKQLQKIQMQIQELQYKNSTEQSNIQALLKINHFGQKQLKPIQYKFAPVMLIRQKLLAKQKQANLQRNSRTIDYRYKNNTSNVQQNQIDHPGSSSRIKPSPKQWTLRTNTVKSVMSSNQYKTIVTSNVLLRASLLKQKK